MINKAERCQVEQSGGWPSRDATPGYHVEFCGGSVLIEPFRTVQPTCIRSMPASGNSSPAMRRWTELLQHMHGPYSQQDVAVMHPPKLAWILVCQSSTENTSTHITCATLCQAGQDYQHMHAMHA